MRSVMAGIATLALAAVSIDSLQDRPAPPPVQASVLHESREALPRRSLAESLGVCADDGALCYRTANPVQLTSFAIMEAGAPAYCDGGMESGAYDRQIFSTLQKFGLVQGTYDENKDTVRVARSLTSMFHNLEDSVAGLEHDYVLARHRDFSEYPVAIREDLCALDRLRGKMMAEIRGWDKQLSHEAKGRAIAAYLNEHHPGLLSGPRYSNIMLGMRVGTLGIELECE